MHETNASLTANLPSLPGVTWEALDRYFAGEATPAEARVVQAALQAHPEVAGIVQHFAGALRGQAAEVDAKAMLQAAIVGSPIVKRDPSNAFVGGPIVCRDAGYPLAGELRPSQGPRYKHLGVPLALAAALTLGFFALKHLPNLTTTQQPPTGATPQTKTYTTAPGQRANITLSDGTAITLAPATTIHVTGAAGRNIDLDGEAVFTVNQQSATPFTVKAGNSIVRVLGTTFGVRKYVGDKSVYVAVAAGKVAANTLVLSAGDVGAVTSDGTARLDKDASAEDMLGWTRGYLVFDDTPLRDVAAVLSRWYNMDFVLADESLGSLPITATLQYGPVSQVIEDVAGALGVQAVRSGRIITISR